MGQQQAQSMKGYLHGGGPEGHGIFAFFYYFNGSGRLTTVGVKGASTSTNTSWVGINTDAVADGETATITLPGGVNSKQSGMTEGATYFVQQDGTITTSTTSADQAGVALSETQLLVADNTANSPSLSSYVSTASLSGYATTSSVTTGLATKAPLASPTFTGVPAAPTASVGTNTTQIATTEFVTAATAATAASVGSIDLVADGAIAAGKAVTLESDGKVKQVVSAVDFTAANAFQTAYENANITAASTWQEAFYGTNVVYDTTNNRFLIIATAQGTNSPAVGSKGAAIFAVTQSGTTYSAGTPQGISTSNRDTFPLDETSTSILHDTTSGRSFAFYGDLDGGVTTLKMIEISGSGNSVTLGTKTTVATLASGTGGHGDRTHKDLFPLTGTGVHLQAGWRASGVNGNNTKTAAVRTITIPASGSPTIGAWQDATSGTTFNNLSNNFEFVVNSQGTKGLMTWSSTNGAYPYAIAAFSISGETVTWGTPVTTMKYEGFLTGSTPIKSHRFCATGDADKFIVSYTSNNDGDVKARVISLSGTTISVGTAFDLGDGTDDSYAILGLIQATGETDKFVAMYQYTKAYLTDEEIYSVKFTRSGTNLANISRDKIHDPGSSHKYNMQYHIPYQIIANPDIIGSYMFQLAQDQYEFGSSKQLELIEGRIGASATTSSQWVGINTTDVSDGETATITLPFNIHTTTGLTVGNTYYVQDNGDISATVSTKVAGRALSTTKLLLKNNFIP